MTISNIGNIEVLLPMNGANNGTTFNELSFRPKNITVTDAITSTGQSKFSGYGSSGYFNGTTARLTAEINNLNISGNFTGQLWLRLDTDTLSSGSNRCIFGFNNSGTSAAARPLILLDDNATPRPLFFTTSTLITGSSGFTVNTWHHFAVVRSGTTVTMYIDGSSVGSATFSTQIAPTNFRIGSSLDTAGYYSGNMSDFMFSVDARYTGAFTPPSRFSGQISRTNTGIDSHVYDRAVLFDWDGQGSSIARAVTPDSEGDWVANDLLNLEYGVAFIKDGCGPICRGPVEVDPDA